MKLEAPKLPPEQKARLKDLIRVFLQIGATSFGSPTAHIAMMESEVVRKRKWLTGEHFLELLAATHLVPGRPPLNQALDGYRQCWLSRATGSRGSFTLPFSSPPFRSLCLHALAARCRRWMPSLRVESSGACDCNQHAILEPWQELPENLADLAYLWAGVWRVSVRRTK